MSAENPISPKAIASTSGAGLATLLTWILGVMAWGASGSAEHVTEAVAAVPAPVAAVIAIGVPAVLAAISGWRVDDPHRVTSAELQALDAMRKAQEV